MVDSAACEVDCDVADAVLDGSLRSTAVDPSSEKIEPPGRVPFEFVRSDEVERTVEPVWVTVALDITGDVISVPLWLGKGAWESRGEGEGEGENDGVLFLGLSLRIFEFAASEPPPKPSSTLMRFAG